VLAPNEFYVPSMATPGRNPPLSIAQLNSSRMICLNCSQCHAEMQGSCVQGSVYQRQKSRSLSPQIPLNQSVLPANIPSLLDLPLLRPSNRFSSHPFGSSQLSNKNNDMDST